jgi:hypothetical protein
VYSNGKGGTRLYKRRRRAKPRSDLSHQALGDAARRNMSREMAVIEVQKGKRIAVLGSAGGGGSYHDMSRRGTPSGPASSSIASSSPYHTESERRRSNISPNGAETFHRRRSGSGPSPYVSSSMTVSQSHASLYSLQTSGVMSSSSALVSQAPSA